MARRGGFRTQAPKQATLGISVVLWLLGLLNGLGTWCARRLGSGDALSSTGGARCLGGCSEFT